VDHAVERKQQLQIRWDVFNVANLQRFGFIDNSRTGIGIAADPGCRAQSAQQLVKLHADPGTAASDAGGRAILVLGLARCALNQT